MSRQVLIFILSIILILLLLLPDHTASYDYYFDSERFNEDFDDEEDLEDSSSGEEKMPPFIHAGVPKDENDSFSVKDSPGVTLEHLKYPGYKLRRFHVANMSLSDFQRHCQYGEGFPCVIEGVEWPAMKNWFNINEKFGPILESKKVDVSVLRRISRKRYAGTVTDRDMIRMPFEEYYLRVFGTQSQWRDQKEGNPPPHATHNHQRYRRRKRLSDRLLYMNNWHFARTNPEMLTDITIPIPFSGTISQHLPKRQYNQLIWIYIGGQGSYSQLHLDVLHTSAWLAPIRGKKLWYFFHSEFAPQFEYNPFQNLDQKHLVRYEHILEPGQVIFVPSKWFHYVRNLPGDNEDANDPEKGASVAITQNFVSVFNLKNVYLQLMGLDNLRMASDFAKMIRHPEVQIAIKEYDMLMAAEDKKTGATGRESLQDFLKRHSWHNEFFVGKG